MKEKQVKDAGSINKTALVTGASRGIGRAIAWAVDKLSEALEFFAEMLRRARN